VCEGRTLLGPSSEPATPHMISTACCLTCTLPPPPDERCAGPRDVKVDAGIDVEGRVLMYDTRWTRVAQRNGALLARM
jgi:hypothetical protein